VDQTTMDMVKFSALDVFISETQGFEEGMF